MISESPYVCSRVFEQGSYQDHVVIGLELDAGRKELALNGLFGEGTLLLDYYSGKTAEVKDDRVTLDTPYGIVLLGL